MRERAERRFQAPQRQAETSTKSTQGGLSHLNHQGRSLFRCMPSAAMSPTSGAEDSPLSDASRTPMAKTLRICMLEPLSEASVSSPALRRRQTVLAPRALTSFSLLANDRGAILVLELRKHLQTMP